MDRIDKFRRVVQAFAETVDVLRIVPRIILVAYGIVFWKVLVWYMAIEPVIIDGVVLIEGPTTQHATLITAVVGVSAAVIGLYQKSGRDWTNPFKKWSDESVEKKEQSE